LSFDAIRDPGFLLLVKSMPRDELRAAWSASAKGKQTAAAKPSTKEDYAKQAWQSAAMTFAQDLNERLLSAAQAGTGVDPQAEPSLPVPVMRDARVVAAYRVDWPAGIREKLSEAQLPALSVTYVKAETVGRLQQISDFYGRQLRLAGVGIPTINLDGAYIETLHRHRDSGMLRSLDVILTRVRDAQPVARPASTSARTQNQLEDLAIEILWIESPDFVQP
jgi:hypothetical protein